MKFLVSLSDEGSRPWTLLPRPWVLTVCVCRYSDKEQPILLCWDLVLTSLCDVSEGCWTYLPVLKHCPVGVQAAGTIQDQVRIFRSLLEQTYWLVFEALRRSVRRLRSRQASITLRHYTLITDHTNRNWGSNIEAYHPSQFRRTLPSLTCLFLFCVL